MKSNSLYRAYEQTRLSADDRRTAVWTIICRYVQRFIPSDSRVLDLGAGYCDFINQIDAQKKAALDIRPEFTRYADPTVSTYVGNCISLSWAPADSLDVVWASNVFEHLSRAELSTCLSEIHRVLRPSGIVIVMQPNFRYCYRTYFDDFTHHSESVFTDRSLADLLACSGFTVVHSEPKFLPFSFKSRFPAIPFLVWLYLWSPWRPWAGQMFLVAEKLTR